MSFLPIEKADLIDRGWDELDIIIVSGDAYVDHPAWAAAILGRVLESNGFRVGIIAQPDWQSIEDFKKLGQPRLFFAVSAGNLDSMVSHYTADLKKRNQDVYSPGGQAGLRPDRTTLVYSNRIREAYPKTPIIIGGIEASLRRVAHYDYWSNKVRGSIILDSRADLLVYGMGEYILLEIAQRLKDGEAITSLHDIRGTSYVSKEVPKNSIMIPSLEEVKTSEKAFADMTRIIYENINPYHSKSLAQAHNDRFVIQNPSPFPLSSEQLDRVYELPYQRKYHPIYEKLGGVPALESVQFSIVTHRACFGGCAFCSLALHQGKIIQNRSAESILREAQRINIHPDFKGTIPDVGGPSANMYSLAGIDFKKCQSCKRISCLHPKICKNLNTQHSSSLALFKKMREIKGINNIFVASGIRYDLILADESDEYLRDLCAHHIGGQLKIAPEHINDYVTGLMNKPGKARYKEFIEIFKKINLDLGKKQYLIPYFIAAHPGCSSKDMLELAEFIRDHLQYYPEQVQNFTPTPMTLSTCMYYTGINPMNGKKVSVPKGQRIRDKQRGLLQYKNPKNYQLVYDTLKELERSDLIANNKKALIKDKYDKYDKSKNKSKKKYKKK